VKVCTLSLLVVAFFAMDVGMNIVVLKSNRAKGDRLGFLRANYEKSNSCELSRTTIKEVIHRLRGYGLRQIFVTITSLSRIVVAFSAVGWGLGARISYVLLGWYGNRPARRNRFNICK
jgi:hypothetical protein